MTEFSAEGSHDGGFHAWFTGKGLISGLEFPDDFEQLDLDMQFSSATTQAAKPFIFDFVPELGAVSGEARLTGNAGDFAIEGIVIRAGSEDSMTVDVQGRVGRFALTPDDR